ncbi:MAG: ATP-dependent DNA ligase, partial [Kiritimatiellae bacterium]|nr:ATP-dependent DNA ligase [Kiritimatiellia bacterium]
AKLAEKLNEYVQDHTIEKKGPVRLVEPGLRALISYDAEVPSPRHKSGVEWLRPRVERIL